MKKVTILSISLAILTVLFAYSCKKKKDEPNLAPDKPTLPAPADAATNIALDVPLSWKTATDPEGGTVTYDIYFGTDATPTAIASSDQGGTEYIPPTLEGNTIYYWKVVAKDPEGATSESTIWSFTTANNIICSFIDSRDGKTYETVTLGNQTWMTENLAYKPSEGKYWAYDNSNANISSYGYLYDWETSKKVCPEGWHLPSKGDWTELEKYLADNGYNYDGTTGGSRAKIAKAMASTSGWPSSYDIGNVGNDKASNNSSGF